MALHPPHEKKQLKAIERQLATAPKIQDDLIKYISRITESYDKVGLDDSIFEFAELVGYRINNSLLDIAQDLDVKSRYGIEKNENLHPLISMAFRGHHNEEFMSEYQFNGLLGKITNDIIEGQRRSKGGLIGGRIGGLIGGRASVETHGDQMGNGGRACRGRGYWQTHPERLEEIRELKYEQGLTWNDTTSEMNEKYGEDWTTKQVKRAYHNNKHRLTDEEE